ncbi:MAG: peptidoglycan DD-metalloendopeptidase family protein [Oscillospiraceae bacterium]|jgi:murein DD-endopeptidase MepM/ murein hydrolase activator NlpD|nr:peptidoglycan DD-metalloendopeptidase family protein [Oscillospiraceae bacterium]
MKLTKITAVMTAACIFSGIAFASVGYTGVFAEQSLSDIAKKKEENNRKIKELEEKELSLGADISEQEKSQGILQEKINLQNENITLVQGEMNDLNEDIDVMQLQIDVLTVEIADQEADIEKNLELFKQRLRAMYISGDENIISVLAGTTDFYDVLAKIEIMQRVAQHDNDLVNDLSDQLDDYNKNKQDLDDQKLKLEVDLAVKKERKTELDSALSQLNADSQRTTDAIERMRMDQDALQRDKDVLERENADLEREDQEIRAAIAEAARKEQERQERIRREQQQKQQQGDSGDRGPQGPVQPYSGRFAWPVPGYNGISSYYGPRWGTQHYGIDISQGGIMGAMVVASESGTVAKKVTGCTHNYGKRGSCGCGGGYGNYVVVVHDNGMSTLYAHCTSVDVNVHDTVSKGQRIGTVGSTGHSTGAHLHFEIMENGAKVNPMNYLNK